VVGKWVPWCGNRYKIAVKSSEIVKFFRNSIRIGV